MSVSAPAPAVRDGFDTARDVGTTKAETPGGVAAVAAQMQTTTRRNAETSA